MGRLAESTKGLHTQLVVFLESPLQAHAALCALIIQGKGRLALPWADSLSSPNEVSALSMIKSLLLTIP